jgi:hypothetical protein
MEMEIKAAHFKTTIKIESPIKPPSTIVPKEMTRFEAWFKNTSPGCELGAIRSAS